MQQPQPMVPMMPSYPPANITTEQIQKYLDENKKLILAILDNQNLGKLAECAQYQAQLQKNLMYLAAIADAQPQTPTMPAQMAPHPAMQPGGFYMQQHPQAAAAAAMAQQPGLFPQKLPLQFNPQQLQEQQQQQQQLLQHHQQALQSQMGIRTGVNTNGMHPPHNELSKQNVSEAVTAGNDGPGGSGVSHGGGDGELSHMKAAEEPK